MSRDYFYLASLPSSRSSPFITYESLEERATKGTGPDSILNGDGRDTSTSYGLKRFQSQS